MNRPSIPIAQPSVAPAPAQWVEAGAKTTLFINGPLESDVQS